MNTALAPEIFAPLHDIIEPKWWTGTPAIAPELFTIDANEFRTAGEPLVPSPALAERMQKTFDDIGPLRYLKKSVNMKVVPIRASHCNPMSMRSAPHLKLGFTITTRWRT
jgi:hypothetical protein